jgi:prepilin-type N-terminal cleavage/methylation domain-containing protein
MERRQLRRIKKSGTLGRVIRSGFTLVEIMIVVLIVGVLLSVAMPSFVSARERARAKACIGNLRQILIAKERWAMDTRAGLSDTPDLWSDLVTPGWYIKNNPYCNAGGTYAAGRMDTFPSCTVGDNTTAADPRDDHIY